MEELLGVCAALPKEVVEAGERARQAQRRAAAREATKRQQQAEQVCDTAAMLFVLYLC